MYDHEWVSAGENGHVWIHGVLVQKWCMCGSECVNPCQTYLLALLVRGACGQGGTQSALVGRTGIKTDYSNAEQSAWAALNIAAVYGEWLVCTGLVWFVLFWSGLLWPIGWPDLVSKRQKRLISSFLCYVTAIMKIILHCDVETDQMSKLCTIDQNCNIFLYFQNNFKFKNFTINKPNYFCIVLYYILKT